MPVSPIDYGRDGHPEMVTIFEEEHRHSPLPDTYPNLDITVHD